MNQTVFVQYGLWAFRAVQGDLGVFYFTNERDSDLLNGRICVTLSIMAGGGVVIVPLGISLGVLSAIKGGWLGRALDTVSLFGLIFPWFFVALIYIVVFAVWLRWLPATGYTPMNQGVWPWAQGLILPILAVIS